MTPHMPNASGIYRITCTVMGRFYIGSSINLHQRKYNHFRELQRNEHHNQYLQRAWNKYGSDAFTFEVLELVLPISLTAREQYWLDKLKPFGNKGFNMTPIAGSTLGRKFSPETKEKMRLKALGRKPSEEARRNMAEARQGKKHSRETRAKMSTTLIGNTRNLGKKATPEAREKMRQANLGQAPSAANRAAVIASNIRRKGNSRT
jgi:Straboviridae intron-associated endonuclease 1